MGKSSIKTDWNIYRMIQSSNIILKEVGGEIILTRKFKLRFCRFSTFSKLQCFNDGVAFIIAIVFSFFTKWKLLFLTCYAKYVSYFQWKKEILPFLEFFNCHFRVLLLSIYFLIVLWGPVNCYYCPTVLTVLQLLYFHEHLVRNPLQKITTMQSGINVKMSSHGNDNESEKNIHIYIFCFIWSPQQSP
jgi:hypothetical protein